jgi:hypothetical protein
MEVKRATSLNKFFLSGCLAVIFLSGGIILGRGLFQEEKEALTPTRKIGYFTFLNEDRSVALIVDVELARMRKTEKFLPLGIRVANKDIYPLKVDRQSFLLVDPTDRTYSMPGYKEVGAAYDKYSLDAKYYALKLFSEGDIMTGFASFRKLPCSFFPHPYKASAMHDVLIDSIEIPQGSFVQDLIYFPRPGSDVTGQKLRLRLQSPELEEPCEVAFIVD